MRISAIILLVLPVFGCGATLPNLRLGEPVPVDAERTSVKVMVSPNNFEYQWYWSFERVQYSLGIDDQGSIQYLATHSSRVRTPEGVHVGQLFEDLQRVKGVRIVEWTGWGHVAELPSGWKAGIFIGKSMTEREPRPGDKVVLIFRAEGFGEIAE